MEAYFDGLRVFQSPDNDIMVIRDERPVMHIACTKQLKKRELIQTVRELRELVIAERKARNRMNLYGSIPPPVAYIPTSCRWVRTPDVLPPASPIFRICPEKAMTPSESGSLS